MRQSQAEIKAIEAELRSIRADKGSSRFVTLLQPNHQSETAVQPIAPTIVRQSPPQPSVGKPQKPTQKRSVECFPLPSNNARMNRALQSQLLDVAEQLQQQSTGSLRRFKQVQSQFLQETSQSQRDTIRHLLAEKAKQINHLSSQQEMVILELMKLSEQLEQNYQISDSRRKQEIEPICEYMAAEVPYVEVDQSGTLVLTTRSIDPINPEDETVAVAHSLRHRTRKRYSLLQTTAKSLWRLVMGILGMVGAVGTFVTAPIGRLVLRQPPSPTRRKDYRGSGRRAATETPFTLQEAATLVVGSVLLRVFMDWIVANYPVLWIPSILIMVTPALIAAYRSTVLPQTGFVWGYRLFSIMIGLLLGGRL
jgi:hypothetical protein